MRYLSDIVRAMTLVVGLVGCGRDYSFLGQRDTDSDVVQRYDAGPDGMDGMQLDGRTDGPAYDARKDAMLEDMRADRYVLGDVMSDGRMPDAGVDAMARDAQIADSDVPDAGRDGYIADSAVADVMPDADPVPDVGNDYFSPCFPAPCIFPDGPSPDVVPDGYIPRDGFIPDAGMDGPVPDALGNDAPACVGLPPSQECFAGLGECRRSGLEYATCDSGSWGSTYSGCDAVAGEAGVEVCDELDNDCDGLVDILEIIDDFNRPNQVGLGNNALGNPWINYGSSIDEWNIQDNAAVTSRTGNESRPTMSSAIGHRSSFNMYVRFKFSELNANNIVALLYTVNSPDGVTDDGFAIRIATFGPSEHQIYRGGVSVATGSFALLANTWYNLQFSFNDSILGAKIWEDGTLKPVDYLLSGPALDVDLSMIYTKFGGILGEGESLTTTIDYLVEGCE